MTAPITPRNRATSPAAPPPHTVAGLVIRWAVLAAASYRDTQDRVAAPGIHF